MTDSMRNLGLDSGSGQPYACWSTLHLSARKLNYEYITLDTTSRRS